MIQFLIKRTSFLILILCHGIAFSSAEELSISKVNYVSVVNNTTIKINWGKIDASIFDIYTLQYSRENSEFQDLWLATNIDDTVFLHQIGQGEEFDKHSYRLICANDTSEVTDAIRFYRQALILNDDEMAGLHWFSPKEGSYLYSIDRRFPQYSDDWITIGQTNALDFVDSFKTCRSEQIEHRIRYLFGADTVYSFINEYYNRPYSLPSPIIDTISILEDNSVALSWEPINIGYMQGYVINRGGYNEFGHLTAYDDFERIIIGKDVSYFDTLGYNSPYDSYQFVVQSLDSCGNSDAFFGLLKTIFLQKPEINTCEKKMDLNWSEYDYYNSMLDHYKVFIWENDILVKDTIVAGTSYTYKELIEESNYRCFIRAVDTSGQKTSSSNRREFFFAYPEQADSIDVAIPSIINDENALVLFSTYPSGNYSSYILQRSTELNGEYENIDSIPLSQSSSFNYSDISVDFDITNYYYKITVLDSCASEVFESEPVSTLNIKGVTESRQINSLIWNNVNTSKLQVVNYNIYRKIDGEQNPSAAIYTESDIGFKDDLFEFEYNDYLDFSSGEGFFEYYIEAVLDDGSIVTSNILELEQITEIFIPNAFTPNGANPIFKPVSVFIQDEGFSMYIYNKWGILIFESHNKDLGWDGKYEGEDMPQDSYAYYIKYNDSAGAPREKKGVLTLIR